MSTKLVQTHIEIEFAICDEEQKKLFKKEFDLLGESDQDPLQRWLKLAKAKGETKDSDNVLLHLMIEVHRKLDRIEKRLNNEKESLLNLPYQGEILGLGHQHFELKDVGVEARSFYGRITMPIFPKRKVPLFFTHEENHLYKIELMHDKDTKDYDSYIIARERALIREMKGYSE